MYSADFADVMRKLRLISILALFQVGSCTIDVTNATDFTVAVVLRRVAVGLVGWGLFDSGLIS